MKKIIGENFVKAVLIENVNTKETQEIETDGVLYTLEWNLRQIFLKVK